MAPVRRLAVIGLGLIGGSLARALRQAQVVERCIGFDADAGQRQAALALGVVDEVASGAAAAVTEADVVVLAVPVLESGTVAAALRPALMQTAVLTDVGSTKRSVLAALRPALGTALRRFVPAHPVAGTEKSGVGAAHADLFRGHRVVLTPTEETDADAVDRVRRLWQAVGAQVETMSPEHHDQVFAATSHLPHVLAYALVDLLGRLQTHQELFRFAAGGFRDFTRVVSSSPKMWHDIVRANRDALLPVVDQYVEALQQLRGAIDRDDAARIFEIFSRARNVREHYLRSTSAGAQP
ncbi:MAG: prephenate dehydrogenase/arogenate dehydrogenase family protein [Gammaproteobacteria bacterium]|nr:prephenate dehydrogenase/arogenate dehydrogenase family protein [Gammaproteobacteria bacterium]